MKKIFLILCTMIASLIVCTGLHSQITGKTAAPVITHAINISVNTPGASITKNACEQNKLNLSFPIQNQGNFDGQVEINISVAGLPETFIISPQPSGQINGVPHYNIGRNSTVFFQASANIKSSWHGNMTVTVNATLIDIGPIHYSDPVPGDNSKNISVDFTGVPQPGNNFCICNISNTMMDTTNSYIIRGATKQGGSGTWAVANNLKVLTTETDAVPVRFKFAGYYNDNGTVPTYYVEFVTSNIYMTRGNGFTGEISFSIFTGAKNQRWVFKKNTNGTYAIFNTGDAGLICTSVGNPFNNPPVINSPVMFFTGYDPTNIYGEFYLVKLE